MRINDLTVTQQQHLLQCFEKVKGTRNIMSELPRLFNQKYPELNATYRQLKHHESKINNKKKVILKKNFLHNYLIIYVFLYYL